MTKEQIVELIVENVKKDGRVIECGVKFDTDIYIVTKDDKYMVMTYFQHSPNEASKEEKNDIT